MGIRDLTKTIRENAPRAMLFPQDPALELSTMFPPGTQYFVDGPVYVNQHFFVQADVPAAMVEMGAAIREALRGEPTFVFDGVCPAAKKHAHAKRRRARQQGLDRAAKSKAQLRLCEEECDAGGSSVDALERWFLLATNQARREVQLGSVTPNLIAEVKTALLAAGYSVLTAPSEGEMECARLARAHPGSVVVTQDMDALVFGAPRVLRDFSVAALVASSAPARKVPHKSMFLVTLSDILEQLALPMHAWLDFCILCGSDFTSGTIPGIGPKTALALVQRGQTVPQIIASAKLKAKAADVPLIAAFEREYPEAHRIFAQ